jgi:hypothetical protein
MTLHPLASKGGAFVLKLGLVFKNKKSRHRRDSLFFKKTGGNGFYPLPPIFFITVQKQYSYLNQE